jgi:hypothetical protein
MTENKNYLVAFLVIAIVAGYFGSIALITFSQVTDSRLAQVIGLVTAVQNAFMIVIGYYFGSSSGSQKKTDLLNELSGTGDGQTVKTNAKITTEKVTTVTPTEPTPAPPAESTVVPPNAEL